MDFLFSLETGEDCDIGSNYDVNIFGEISGLEESDAECVPFEDSKRAVTGRLVITLKVKSGLSRQCDSACAEEEGLKLLASLEERISSNRTAVSIVNEDLGLALNTTITANVILTSTTRSCDEYYALIKGKCGKSTLSIV